ncbi:Uma2 family endonuclease [Actinomadura formosensis]|uniref:Uma2 family endonuclease n=1 Tax=Actinomadura formosensis TaxID=60706 RepID=UPI000AF409C8|nr:Uma2 family endonuclease [Actinomadura formosensis]
MTVMVHEPLSHGDDDVVLEGFLALDTPEGFRAELIDGEIVVSPPPGSRHERNMARINRQVTLCSSTAFDFSGNMGLVLPGDGGLPSYVIPDGTFAPLDLDVYDNEDSWSEPDGIAMVVEVTSSKPGPDREAKRYGYARAEIPLYLLVDRDEKQAVLFSQPDGKDYTSIDRAPFGKGLALPEPFGFELDTSEFV